MDLRSNLSRAKGLGSAKGGTCHWLMQRVSALILLLTFAWFLQFCYNLSSKNIYQVFVSIKTPYNSCGLVLFVLAALYHGMLGMQIIIEDYISNIAIRHFMIILLKIFVTITSVSFIVALVYLIADPNIINYAKL
jgi:succinate dehydrogenase / fumarate reductase membrane anchor subunit